MNLFINKVISSILQIILFAIIPFIWWCITARKQQSFPKWIGLKKIEGGRKTVIATILVSVAFLASGVLTLYVVRGMETATSEFTGLGAAALPAIVVYAAFNTAFPEELLFRGFLLKRLSNKFGFHVANFIQAFLFGLLHGVMFFTLAGAVKAVLIIAFTGAIAWFMGYVNEKCQNLRKVPKVAVFPQNIQNPQIYTP